MAVRLKDIADRLNVSVQAVSIALNNRPSTARISDELRERIVRTANEMGYRPNRLARGLAQGRSRTLGLLQMTGDYSPFTRVASGVEDEALAAGFLILVCNTYALPERERTYLRAFAEARVDGIIAVASSHTEMAEEVLAHRPAGTPLVSVNRRVDQANVISILIKNREAARKVTEHLLEQGRRRIAYLDAPEDAGLRIHPLQSSVDRREGYRDAMRAAGLEPRVVTLTDAWYENRVEAARSVASRLLEEPEPPDALFGVTDYAAAGALYACLSCGLRVPEDVAVAGFDDAEIGRFAMVPITTVRQPFYEAGRQAVRHLLSWKESESPAYEYLECELLPRASTGAMEEPKTSP